MLRSATTWTAIGVAGALIALLAYGVTAKSPDSSIDAAIAVGKRPQPPQTPLPTLGGGAKQSLAGYATQVVIVNVWASWCTQCVHELPLLERLQQRLKRRRATVVGIATKDLSADALASVRRFRLTYPTLHDGAGVFSRRLGIAAVPETFVLDRRGRIAALRRGPVTQAWLDSTLPPLLSEPT